MLSQRRGLLGPLFKDGIDRRREVAKFQYLTRCGLGSSLGGNLRRFQSEHLVTAVVPRPSLEYPGVELIQQFLVNPCRRCDFSDDIQFLLDVFPITGRHQNGVSQHELQSMR